MTSYQNNPSAEGEKTQERGSLEHRSSPQAELREKAGIMALSVDARASSPDILSGMEGGPVVPSESSKKATDPRGGRSSPIPSGVAAAGAILAERAFPSEQKLIRGIRSVVQKAIRETEGQVKRLGKSPLKNAKALSDAVALLRCLWTFISGLQEKTLEALKNIWKALASGSKIIDLVR